MKFTAILNRFEPASIIRMFNNAKMVAKHSKKSLLYVLFDMSKSILKEHVGYMEYNMFGFIDKTPEQRKTFMTFDYSQAIFNKLNDRAYFNVFNDKLTFNKRFKEYIGRDFIDASLASYEEFETFCKGKKTIYCKPKNSWAGHGIYKRIHLDEEKDLKAVHQFMIDNNLYCEDEIIQHPLMASLHPTSINTIRMCTVCYEGKAHFMYALLRMGTDYKQVDNVGSGGVYSVLDNEDGILTHPAWSDETIMTYENHPTTNTPIIGFKIPYYKEAIELILKAALVEQHMGYIGWDVAITENGPILVEGNQLPAYDMPQNCYVTQNPIGLKPKFEAIIGPLDE